MKVLVRNAAVAIGLFAIAAPPGLASPIAPPRPGSARLQGKFKMNGTVTVAENIRGEHRGEKVIRAWTFTPLCSRGVCATIKLVRTRGGGATDTVKLHRRAPGFYQGPGSFYAPLRCGGTTWPRGQFVRFTIAVKILSASEQNGTVIATRIKGSYANNRPRYNRTPCVAVLGHDAATYKGQLVPSATAS